MTLNEMSNKLAEHIEDYIHGFTGHYIGDEDYDIKPIIQAEIRSWLENFLETKRKKLQEIVLVPFSDDYITRDVAVKTLCYLQAELLTNNTQGG